ncbi:hypothetical protein McanMca71_001087 [Microsporum canis]|uniref:Nitrate reductase n=1 Tax=Arthroderma otae (strain ATCC MYA-4605 / CBS 113480) TaxID=554155 RepID=C5FHD0_ARTOC|nr:nitrate reductase [Microsporum canis CBS 113480]EEQ28849.1 nitrate reductase [Microsporum canis CBS 113480]
MPSYEPIQIEPIPVSKTKEVNIFSLKSPVKNGDEFVNTFDIPLPPPAKKPLEVLDIDKETPDGHVPRDPIQVRLTGVHPLNSESPLTALFDEGFLTSPELFFVRNHGAVPVIEQDDILNWELSIEGLVENPIVLTLRQIISDFQQVTCPVTLVCAGNRRKEQNMVRKSKGFNWGAAGLSTALFTGPMMHNILSRAKPMRKAKYMCMEGADALPNGNYGTSIRLSTAMDPAMGVMLAYMMNGEPLRQDHGWPLRAVIPGHIGGRSVKWITKIILTENPSDNWYHIYDNRVLPTMCSPEMATEDDSWWRDERYVIQHLNVNSAIAYPQHDEEVVVSSTPSYTIKGYAYGGGGRQVSRIEVSLDSGKTWRLSSIQYDEDRYRATSQYLYGGQLDLSWRETYFCWCFWSLEVQTHELETADSIVVRAMDESLNIQPREMYWSVLGMMNNPWFRITISKENGVLKFKHPTLPATQAGGWMEAVKKAGGDLTDGNWGEASASAAKPVDVKPEPEINMKKPGLKVNITLEEFMAHNSRDTDPWFVVDGEVYDGTPFLEGHPGGAQSIISTAATDCTEEFLAIHSESAKAMMPDYHLGTLDPAALRELQNSQGTSSKPLPIIHEWEKVTLTEKTNLSLDTALFTFSFADSSKVLGIGIGQHIMLKVNAKPNDPTSAVIRAITPLSDPRDKGSMGLLIKIYRPAPGFAGGQLTVPLDKLPIGSEVDYRLSSHCKFEYLGRGRTVIDGTERHISSFNMICGGSGITPMFQVLRAILQDDEDTTTCTLLDGNRTEDDIMCRAELASFVSCDTKNKFQVIHTLTQPSKSWSGYKGRISEGLISRHIVRSENSMVLICGPASLENSAKKILLAQQWNEDDIFFF